MNKRYVVLSALGLILFFGSSYEASAQHKGISFQAVMKKSDGSYPTATGITVIAQILDPMNHCVLREEEHMGKNISNGYLNLVLGDSGASTPGTRNPSPVLSLSQVMDNKTTRTNLKCVDQANNIVATGQSYIPSSVDRRILRIRLNLQGEDIAADFNMRTVPYAINAENLNGKSEVDFINVNAAKNVTQGRLEDWFSSVVMGQVLNGTYNAPTATTLSGTLNSSQVSGLSAVAISGDYADLSNKPLTVPAVSGQSGKFLTTDGSGLSWQTVSGVGAVSSVAGRTGAVTLSPSDIAGFSTSVESVIASQKNQNNGLAALDSSGKLVSSQMPDHLTALTGDVVASGTGSVVATVARIQGYVVAPGNPMNGLMTWNTSLARWEAVNPPTCSASQVLIWSSTSDSFSCTTINGVSAANISGLATVASSGSYTDLSARPTLGALAAKSSVATVDIAANAVTASKLGNDVGAWAVNASDIYRSTGKVGVGVSTPGAALEVNGGIKISMDSDACSYSKRGTIRFNTTSRKIEYCNESAWVSIESDLTPDAMVFVGLNSQDLNKYVYSEALVANGISGTTNVTVTGSGAALSVNGGSWVTSSTVNPGQTIRLRLLTSASVNTAVSATLTVGTYTAPDWVVRTYEELYTPMAVSQSTVYSSMTAGNVSMLTDNDETTATGTNSGTTEWIKVDLGSNKDVGFVRLGGGYIPAWGYISGYLNGATLQYSTNDSTWITIRTVAGVTDSGDGLFAHVVFPQVTARYLRIYKNGWTSTSEFVPGK